MIKKQTDAAVVIIAGMLLLVVSIALTLVLIARIRNDAQNQNMDTDAIDVNQSLDDSEDSSSTEADEETDRGGSIFQGDASFDSEESEDTEEQKRWTVKAYMGQVGIFRSDGSIELLLDTYIKALPKADRELLEEGFEIYGIEEFNSVVEDYGD